MKEEKEEGKTEEGRREEGRRERRRTSRRRKRRRRGGCLRLGSSGSGLCEGDVQAWG